MNGILLFCAFLEKRYNLSPFQQDYTKKAGERILEIGKNLAANRAAMKELFADCGDIVFRDFAAAEGQGQLFLVYVDNMVNTTAVEDAIKKSEPIPEWHQFFANEKNATKNNAGKN